jgi:hypothetical protein
VTEWTSATSQQGQIITPVAVAVGLGLLVELAGTIS